MILVSFEVGYDRNRASQLGANWARKLRREKSDGTFHEAQTFKPLHHDLRAVPTFA
jgi:hypothetical protein